MTNLRGQLVNHKATELGHMIINTVIMSWNFDTIYFTDDKTFIVH